MNCGRVTAIIADFEVVPSVLLTLTKIFPSPLIFGVTATLFIDVVAVLGDQPEGKVQE